jgi:hypothetical protein
MGAYPVTVFAETIQYAQNIELVVKKTNQSNSDLTSLVRQYYGRERDQHLEFKAKRMMVLVTSVQMTVRTAALIRQIVGQAGVIDTAGYVGIVTAESSVEEFERVIDKSTIIVCTTILSSSVNVRDLNMIIILATTYSMTDTVQAIGRVGRDGSPAKAFLLFDKRVHEQIFGCPGTQQYVKSHTQPLMWAHGQANRSVLKSLYAPFGVLEFVTNPRHDCFRVLIAQLHGTIIDPQSLSCTSNVGRGAVSCSACREIVIPDSPMQQTGRSVATIADIDEEVVLEPPNLEPTAPARRVVSRDSNISIKDLFAGPRDPRATEALRSLRFPTDSEMAAVHLDPKSVPMAQQSSQGMNDSQSSQGPATEFYAIIHAVLTDMSKRQCFMCSEASCNGFRDSAKYGMCKARSRVVERPYSFICFGCGGEHKKTNCFFRPGSDRPEVPAGRTRCFGCFLPQHAKCGFSFHSGAGNESGSQSSQFVCQQRGDNIFAMLSAFFFARKNAVQRFLRDYKDCLASEPPLHQSIPQGFQMYWEWLWVPSPVNWNVHHLDVVLAFMIEEVRKQ